MSAVDSQREAAAYLAGDLLQQVSTFATDAVSAFSSIEYPWINLSEGAPIMPPAGGASFSNAPALPPSTAQKPDSLDLSDRIPSITPDPVPGFNIVPPIIVLPVSPNIVAPIAPSGAPEFNAPLLPVAPQVTLPPVPQFQQLNLPTLQSLQLPVVVDMVPADGISSPSASFVWAEAPYQSAMLDSAKAKLLADLNNGGYGIETQDEAMLWAREMDREARNGAMAVQDLARQHAARGFTAPSGAMLAQIQAAQQASLEKLSSASRDIALKRADMYVDNRKFTLQQVKELEQILIGYYSAMQERALNSAKAVVELGVAVFNAQAARLRLLNERAALKLQVFEAQLKAQLAHLDEYKAQAEVARVSAEVQRIQVEVYKAQVDAAMSSVNLYKAQMEGAQTAAQIENLKLQGFKAQVDTYTAQVGAYEAQFRAYESQIRGEASKVQAFAAQVDGYKAQVEAVTAKTQGQVAGMDAQLKPMMFRLEKYRAQVERYRADLQYDLQNMERLSKDWGLQMGAQKMLADVNMKNSEAQMWAAKASADVATSRASVAAQVAIASAHQSATVANGIAGVNATLAATYANAASSISSGISSLGVEITST